MKKQEHIYINMIEIYIYIYIVYEEHDRKNRYI